MRHSFGDQELSQNDPTDSALAAIASIMDESHAALEHAAVEQAEAEPMPVEASAEEAPATAPPPPEANGYSRLGPGPMAALRFRWTAREHNGDFYVDETIGETSTPVVSGPMDRDAAIKFVDDREAAARERFEALKHEIISRSAIAGLVSESEM